MRFLGFIVALSIFCSLHAADLDSGKDQFQLRMLKAIKRHAPPQKIIQENNSAGEYALPLRQAFSDFVHSSEFSKDEIDLESYQEHMKQYIESLPSHNRYMPATQQATFPAESLVKTVQHNPTSESQASTVKSVSGEMKTISEAEAREQTDRFKHLYENIQGKAFNENRMAEVSNENFRRAVNRMSHQDLANIDPDMAILDELTEIAHEPTLNEPERAREQFAHQKQAAVQQPQQPLQQQNMMMLHNQAPQMPAMMPNVQMHPAAVHHANMMHHQRFVPPPPPANFAPMQVRTPAPQIQTTDRRAQNQKNLQGSHLSVKTAETAESNDRYKHFYESIESKKAYENNVAKSRHITRP